MQLVPITTNVVSLNPAYGKVYLVLYTTLCDKVCQVSVFFPGTPVTSTNKTDRRNIAEILLKVGLNTTALTL